MLQTTVDAQSGDDAVTFTLRVENTGDDDVELSFSDGQRVRVSVYHAADGVGDRDPVWRSDEGRMFAQMLGSETVPAGGSIEFDEEWTEPEDGTYLVVGEVVCRDRELADETTVSV